MFGRLMRARFIGFIIPAGVAGLILELFANDKITLYIHPRYKIFSLTMAILALILVSVYFVATKAWRTALKPDQKKKKLPITETIVVVLFLIIYTMPPSTLSSRAVERKTVNLPSSSSISPEDLIIDCPQEDPASLELWVFYLSAYDPACYEGKAIEVEGFAVDAADSPAPDGYFYLGKLMVSCCVIDARPYALPIELPQNFQEEVNSWYKVNGTLTTVDLPAGRSVVVDVKEISSVEAPENPYDYYSQ